MPTSKFKVGDFVVLKKVPPSYEGQLNIGIIYRVRQSPFFDGSGYNIIWMNTINKNESMVILWFDSQLKPYKGKSN